MKLKSYAHKAAVLGVFGALASVIAVAENAIPPIPFMPAGAKLGLSNILLMYLVMEAGLPYAAAVTLFKSTVVLLTRGVTSAAMSLAGGLISLLAVYLFCRIRQLGSVGLCIIGAAAHNAGQLCVCILITGGAAIYYLPPLMLFSILTGTVTGITLYCTMPLINKTVSKVR